MNNKFSTSFLYAREAAFQRGDAGAYNAFDSLYRAACIEEAKERAGQFNVFSNVNGSK